MLVLFACANIPKDEKVSENWIELFNGKDLAGWTPKFAGHPLGENYKNTFRVEDGLLKVDYAEYDSFDAKFGHLYYTSPFSRYKLKVEYRFTGEQVAGGPGWAIRNSGAMLHCQDPTTITLDQNFPHSIEAQFLGGNGVDDRSTANLCTPGTHVEMNGKLITNHCINSLSQTYHGEQWVTIEMVVLGDEVIHHIIGQDTVLTYNKPQIGGLAEDDPYSESHPDGTPIQSGYISLQSESHPIEFRKVSLLDLSSEK